MSVSCQDRDAYLNGLLEERESSAFESHVARCATCTEAIEAWSHLQGELRSYNQSQLVEPSAADIANLVGKARRHDEGSTPRVWFWRLSAAAVATACVAVLGWTQLRPGSGPPLAIRALTSVGPTAESLAVGQLITAPVNTHAILEVGDDRLGIAAAGQIKIVRADRRETRVALSKGRIAARVERRTRDAEFVIEAGKCTVRVVGTEFAVEQTEGETLIDVAHGRVVVEGENSTFEVNGGERLACDCEGEGRIAELLDSQVVTEILTTVPDADAGTEPTVPDEKPAAAIADAKPRRPALDYAELSEWLADGRHGKLQRRVRLHLRSHPKDARAWMLLADSQRKSARWREAVESYEKVALLGAGEDAARARFVAAGLLQDRLAEHGRAIPLLQKYIADRSAPKSLKSAATVRLARSYVATGKDGVARRLLEALLKDEPGAAAAEARVLLSEIERRQR